MADFGTSNKYIVYSLNASESNIDVTNNRSLVTVTLDVRRTNTGYTTYGTGTAYVRINGSLYSVGITTSQKITSTSIRLGTWQVWVPHNNDGSKTISITGWISHSQFSSSEQGYNQTLTKIPRQAVIDNLSGASKLTDTFTYKYTPQTDSYFYKVRISIPNVIAIKTIALGNQSTGQKTGTFTLTSADLTTVLNNVTSKSSSVVIGVVIETYANNTYSNKIGESIELKQTVKIPTTITAGSITVKDSNTSVTAITGSSAYIIQNKSTLTVTIGSASVSDCATTSKKATIEKYEVTVNGQTKFLTSSGTLDFGKVTGSSNLTGTMKITTSRGTTLSKKFTVNVVAYLPPTVKISTCYRANSDGIENVTSGEYVYIKVTFGVSSVTIDGNAKNVVKTKVLTIDGNSRSTTFVSDKGIVIGTITNEAHTIVAVITDSFGVSSTYTYSLKSATVPFSILKNKKSVGLGGIPTGDDMLYIGYPMLYMNSGENTLKLQYNKYWGFDNVTGNYIRTPTSGLLPNVSGGSGNIGTSSWPFNRGYFKNLFVNGRSLKDDTVLWSGSQTAYTHSFTLNSEALNFRELIVIVKSDNHEKAVYLPIVGGSVLDGSTSQGTKWIDINVTSYTQSTKKIVLSTAAWTSPSVNEGTTITKIIGR